MSSYSPNQVEHDQAHQVFELKAEGQTAYLEYRYMGPQEVAVSHTVTPTALRGRGLASILSQAATAYFRQKGLKVHPHCWFYARYLQKHPREQDVLSPGALG